MWILCSVAAAILWGLDYALAGRLLKSISFPTLLMVEFFVGFLVMAVIASIDGNRTDVAKLFSSAQTVSYLLLAIAAFVIAHVLIVISIGEKNATLASLIEMSYPFFVAGFSWLLFKEGQANEGTIAGGVLVFVGVALIYFFNK